jgi:hypothetical protein
MVNKFRHLYHRQWGLSLQVFWAPIIIPNINGLAIANLPPKPLLQEASRSNNVTPNKRWVRIELGLQERTLREIFGLVDSVEQGGRTGK